MINKILIIEEIDSISLGISTLLNEHFTVDVRCTKYCDEALLKVKKAIFENAPFDLIITDLSFKTDHREAKLLNGTELIAAIRQEQPDVRIIVYSVEERIYKIRNLFEEYGINGFVAKGRESSQELLEAITTVNKCGSIYISPQFQNRLRDTTPFEIDEFDEELILYLSRGLTQEEISMQFRKEGKTSSSTSSIEKKINKLKIVFKAKNTIHLVAIAKDIGII